MDDIGNLVYILVFIIWFLYKVFGKGKKKQPKPWPPMDSGGAGPRPTSKPSKQESTAPPVTFEDILRELTGAPPEIPEKEPEIIDEIPERYPMEDIPSSMEETSFEVYETAPETGTGPDLVREAGRFNEFAVPQEQNSKAAREVFKMLRNKNGLKQAIILKEILDRPYS